MKKSLIIFLFIICSFPVSLKAERKMVLTVSQKGEADFKTISEAVRSIPQFNYERVIILIKAGLYEEKIRIDRDYITLLGESPDRTFIKYPQLRSDWDASKDSIGPGIINIFADDIIIEGITVENTQPQIGPHAFTIYGTGTRTILLQSRFISKGGDTVSLWDHKTGLYYCWNCYFEGAVDFVCPRGWCYIRDSEFYEVKKSAALWHAGGENINQKFVLQNCRFGGVEGWELGRHHYDAQFILLDCKFSKTMSDRPIYRVTYPDQPERDRPFNWGERYYFLNCSREGGNPDWLINNLPGIIKLNSNGIVNASSVYGGRWDPEKLAGPSIIKFKIEGTVITLYIDEKVTVEGSPSVIAGSKKFLYHSGSGTNILKFIGNEKLDDAEIGTAEISGGAFWGTGATVSLRQLESKLTKVEGRIQ